MSEEYEIIFITDEGRAIINKKTRKVYHSEFEIIEEKNKEIDRLNNIMDKAKEYIKEWQRFPHTNGSTHKELENLMKILDKSLKEKGNK